MPYSAYCVTNRKWVIVERRTRSTVEHPGPTDEASPLVALARDLLTREPGERIPTVAEYQDRLGIGSGTVQARLRTLSAVGAVRTRAHGHRGTVLVWRNLSELWSLARNGPVTGIMPLPEALEPVSLAAVLRRGFQRLKIPLELLYLHGATRRIELVRQGEAQFTVTSRPAALALADVTGSWLCRDLGAESYHREHSMVVLLGRRVAAGGQIRRVGIDPSSHDHSLLTRLEFPASAGFVHEPFPHARLPAAVAEEQIDAAVWLQATLAIPLSSVGISTRPLQAPEAIAANEALGRAVLIAPPDDVGVASVLSEIDLAGVGDMQDEILRSDVLPLY
jgi:hypothetical protein